MSAPANAWDKLPQETDVNYLQFWYYLNAGPRRSLRQAYVEYARTELDVTPSDSIPGTFKSNSSRFDWVARALAYDLHQIRIKGHSLVNAYLRALEHITIKAEEAAEERSIDDPAWPVILESLEFVGRQLKPAMDAGMFPAHPAVAHAGTSDFPALPAALGEPDRSDVE